MNTNTNTNTNTNRAEFRAIVSRYAELLASLTEGANCEPNAELLAEFPNGWESFSAAIGAIPYAELLKETRRAELLADEDTDMQGSANLLAELLAVTDEDIRANVRTHGIGFLTRKNQPFAGKALAKNADYLAIPTNEPRIGELLARATNWGVKLQTVKGEYRLTVIGTGGKTSDAPADAFNAAIADVRALPARIDAIRAQLGVKGQPLTDEQLGVIMARFKGSHVQCLVMLANRYDVMRTAKMPVTFDTLAPKADDARAKVSK
jgi:hypothetical protein